MESNADGKTVVVTGDFTLDWNLALSCKLGTPIPAWETEAGSRLRWQRGGAGMLADLIAAVAAGLGSGALWTVRQMDAPRRSTEDSDARIGPENPEYHHSYALWLPYGFPADDDRKPAHDGRKKDDQSAWRVAESLGVNRRLYTKPPGDWARVQDDDPEAALVVLDDANLGFRSNPDLWPASLTQEGRAPWVLVKTSRPVAQGPLWEMLYERHAERTIALMTVNDLRLTEVQISRGLSWERTAQDLVWEIQNNDALDGLRKCAHVVVSFYAAGAFLYSRGKEGEGSFQLIFDPKVIEGMWEQDYPGRMVGYSTCLAAGIARQVMLDPKAPKIDRGILAGVSALRALHREGYGAPGAKTADVRLAFPVKTVASALAAGDATLEKDFAKANVPPRPTARYWTILSEHYSEGLEKTAREIVLDGPEKALRGVPLGRFGKLLTVDRQEIESLRSIRSLTIEYLAQEKPERPLSVAVFGPPGAGKSFGITQLAQALRPGEIEKREFNLSQLHSTDDLVSAFHQIRDIGLSGKIPLVFWDEFDSSFGGSDLGWLKYFLAPMQDGRFLHGDLTHPIGSAIFVFAGGTSSTLDNFGAELGPKEKRAAKVPDFVSRLKGYINVLGPNPQAGVDDPYFVLRRAVLLRALLSANAHHLFVDGVPQIDSGVLRALLQTKIYNHGARSMESLIAMSQIGGRSRFERSALPPLAQMNLHVDATDFLELVHFPEFKGAKLERMAEKTHEFYRKQQEADGWTWGAERNDEKKKNPSLVDYGALREEEKEQNRDQVRDIPAKLAHVGCHVIPLKDGQPPFEFSTEMIEELASMEHTRWMRLKARRGCRYADKTDGKANVHQCMLPWMEGDLKPYEGFTEHLGAEELPEREKDKDRNAIRNIAKVIACGGYTVVGPSPRAKSPATGESSEPETGIR